MVIFADCAETRILEAAIPSIRKICWRKWGKTEYQDRVSEACLIFLEDLRTMRLNTGHFLEEVRADLEVKMGELNRRTPSPRFDHCSLDAFASRKTGETFDGKRFFPSKLTDPSAVEVKEFLEHLPPRSRAIVELLLEGFDESEIPARLRMSTDRFEREMEDIRHQCGAWYANTVEG